MSKKTHTAEQPAAGAAVPEKDTAIPAHKRQYITRHGGSVVLDAPAVTAQDTTDQNANEARRNAEKP